MNNELRGGQRREDLASERRAWPPYYQPIDKSTMIPVKWLIPKLELPQ
jgi:hypothetical protein